MRILVDPHIVERGKVFVADVTSIGHLLLVGFDVLQKLLQLLAGV